MLLIWLFLQYTANASFFIDLSTRTFKKEVIQQLHENTPIILCNQEKIFLSLFVLHFPKIEG